MNAAIAAIGNDVVDLRDPDSNPKTHPRRFDERVFSPNERRLLERASDSSGSPDSASLR
jgi:phosphopantetheinyl transferase (holo-ACP synthase)